MNFRVCVHNIYVCTRCVVVLIDIGMCVYELQVSYSFLYPVHASIAWLLCSHGVQYIM